MLRAEPIFFRSLTKGKGSRRTAFSIENQSDVQAACRLLAVRDCPEWLHLERVLSSGEIQQLLPLPDAERIGESDRARHPSWLLVPPRHKVQLIASVDTDHRYFPRADSELPADGHAIHNENATIELELDGQRLEIPVAIAEVVLRRDDFDGTFALDFGTTNSCFAYKRRRSGPEGLERPPACSPEIPSAIYFRDLRLAEDPRVLVGTKARLAMIQSPDRVYAYCESVKRLLGDERGLTFLDSRGRTATYRPRDVASLVIHKVLERAETKALDSQRIRRVVATYPTLFSPRQRRALQDAILQALDRLEPGRVPEECLSPDPREPEVQARCDALVALRMDEANAATFRHVTGTLLESCFRFNRDQTADVLSFDFGGGTIDVACIRVDIKRDVAKRSTSIETRVLGVTGEPHYGGDNVSLELLKLVRARLVVEASRALLNQDRGETKSRQASAGLDIFDRILDGTPSTLGPGDPAQATNGSSAALPLDERMSLARTVAQHAQQLLSAVLAGPDHPEAAEGGDPTLEHLRDLLRLQAAEEGRPFQPGEPERVLGAMERLLPTRFARYADSDPVMEQRAKVFFMDLWRECNDRLKPLLVARAGGDTSLEAAEQARSAIQEPLERLAAYLDIDPKLWNDRVAVSLAELEALIEPRVTQAVTRARDLYLRAVEEDAGASAESDDAGEADDPDDAPILSSKASGRFKSSAGRRKLTLLITGNSSILPVVRRTFAEVFKGIDHELVWDERTRKTAVVQGAVEEELLAREFGQEGGGIHYSAVDFSDRIPFTIGLYSRFVGFRPLLPRGTVEGTRQTVDSALNELIGPDLPELPVYVDTHDGAPVRYLGVFDFTTPPAREATDEDLAELATGEDEPYQARLRLLPNWELEYVDPRRKQVWRLQLSGRRVEPREDPFAGVS